MARLSLAALFLLCSAPALAQDGAPASSTTPDPVLLQSMADSMAGAYDLKSITGNRQCQFRLSADAGQPGRKLVFPVGCRRAFPQFRLAAGWSVNATGDLLFLNQNADVISAFPAAEGRLVGVDATGEVKEEIIPLDAVMMDRRLAVLNGLVPSAPAPTAPPIPVPQTPALTPVPPDISTPKQLEGWYQVMRYGNRDSGCKLALLSTDATSVAGKAAALDANCSDQGMKIFAPIAWRLENGQLVLTARRGHELPMAKTPRGSWTKAVPSGEELELLKAE
jgi:hypothetical protein